MNHSYLNIWSYIPNMCLGESASDAALPLVSFLCYFIMPCDSLWEPGHDISGDRNWSEQAYSTWFYAFMVFVQHLLWLWIPETSTNFLQLPFIHTVDLGVSSFLENLCFTSLSSLTHHLTLGLYWRLVKWVEEKGSIILGLNFSLLTGKVPVSCGLWGFSTSQVSCLFPQPSTENEESLRWVGLNQCPPSSWDNAPLSLLPQRQSLLWRTQWVCLTITAFSLLLPEPAGDFSWLLVL